MTNNQSQFILPITRNKIKVIEKMEEEYNKLNQEIRQLMAKHQSPGDNDKLIKSLEKQMVLHKQQAKYYKKIVYQQKSKLKEVTSIIDELHSISEDLLMQKKKSGL